MSEANAELVRTIYERFRAGDTDGALALLDAKIELYERPEGPDPQVYHGHQGFLESVGVNRAAFAGLDIVPEEFIEAGDRVVAVTRFLGTGRESGVPVDQRLYHVFTVRNGKVVRVDVRSDRHEALRLAGV